MSDIAICVENLSKRYTIGASTDRHDGVHDRLKARAVSLFQQWRRSLTADETIWALKDVSFEVKRGEVVGIVGGNGAGKSTLLKILSRITEPTSGHAKMYGRSGSLLEVGTGFHAELTGRDNIYLSGAILGMRKTEIDLKFDEIVAFAEIDKFLDTPVKHYSSGMYVRLAFAVAAHLQPDILIVDEVLAVGDASFQQKCMGKMQDVSKEGRTVLFVSHNTSVLLNLCPRGILLESGKVERDGKMIDIVRQYVGGRHQCNVFQPSHGERVGDQRATIEDFEVTPNPPQTGGAVDFIFVITRPHNASLWVDLCVSILTEEGMPLLQLYSSDMGVQFALSPGRNQIQVGLERLPLAPGRYRMHLWMGTGEFPIDWIRDGFLLSVEPGFLHGKQYVMSKDFPVLIPAVWR